MWYDGRTVVSGDEEVKCVREMIVGGKQRNQDVVVLVGHEVEEERYRVGIR